MVVESLLSINLLMNSNSYVIFFCDSNVAVTITASQQKAMIWEMPRQPTTPSLRNSALPWPWQDEFCGAQAGEKPYPAVWQSSGLENENFAEAYERPVIYFGIKTINSHAWLFKGLRREQGWDALKAKKGAVRILAEDKIVEKNSGKPWSRVISRHSLKLSDLLSLLNHYYKSPRLYCWIIYILLSFFLSATLDQTLRIQ